jgi:hypothetical protein
MSAGHPEQSDDDGFEPIQLDG